MFINNINPALFKIGSLEVRYYGLVYAIGFLLVYYILKRSSTFNKKDLDDYVFYLMVSLVLGARAMHVVGNFSYYINRPLEILMIWQGGMAFYGGLIGIVLFSYFYFKKKNLSFLKIADVLVMPAAFILALGRIANFINGELYGAITNLNWCVKFKDVDGCRHPLQLYYATKRFLIFGILLFLSKRRYKDGFLFFNFIFLIGLGRFILDFFKDSSRYFGLTLEQYFSIIMVVIGFIVLIKNYRKDYL